MNACKCFVDKTPVDFYVQVLDQIDLFHASFIVGQSRGEAGTQAEEACILGHLEGQGSQEEVHQLGSLLEQENQMEGGIRDGNRLGCCSRLGSGGVEQAGQ